MKVIIELEFDTYKPTTQDIIDYINELGVDLDYKIEKTEKEKNLTFNYSHVNRNK